MGSGESLAVTALTIGRWWTRWSGKSIVVHLHEGISLAEELFPILKFLGPSLSPALWGRGGERGSSKFDFRMRSGEIRQCMPWRLVDDEQDGQKSRMLCQLTPKGRIGKRKTWVNIHNLFLYEVIDKWSLVPRGKKEEDQTLKDWIKWVYSEFWSESLGHGGPKIDVVKFVYWGDSSRAARRTIRRN